MLRLKGCSERVWPSRERLATEAGEAELNNLGSDRRRTRRPGDKRNGSTERVWPSRDRLATEAARRVHWATSDSSQKHEATSAEEERLHRESLAIKREIGDRQGEADFIEQTSKARQLKRNGCHERVAREIGNRLDEALNQHRERLAERLQRVGDWRPTSSFSLSHLAIIVKHEAIAEERLFRESLAIAREIGDRQGEATIDSSVGTEEQRRLNTDPSERNRCSNRPMVH